VSAKIPLEFGYSGAFSQTLERIDKMSDVFPPLSFLWTRGIVIVKLLAGGGSSGGGGVEGGRRAGVLDRVGE
jgi:hypothetical protein